MELRFAVWAPDQQTFWDSWVSKGIAEWDADTSSYVITNAYQGIETNAVSWPGIIVDVPGTYDEEGVELTPPTYIDGWHTNVVVKGPLVAQMTAGLDQTEEVDGEIVLKSIFDRTHAVDTFSLINIPRSPITKFPAGYQNPSTKVAYADNTDLSTPSNIIL